MRKSIIVLLLATFQIACSSSSPSQQEPPRSTSYTYKSYLSDHAFQQIKATPLIEEGYRGSGLTAAVIDSDFNCNDPTLAGKCSQEGAIDYKDIGGVLTEIQDLSFLDSASGHGNAMSRILVGSKNDAGQVGIAPEAKILPYDHRQSVNTFYHVLAHAQKKGAKVVSMSIFSSLGWIALTPDWFQMDYNNNPGNPADIQNILIFLIAGNIDPTFPHITHTRVGVGKAGPFDPPLGNIIVTVAVDENNRLTPYSRACGNTQRFCLAVPGDATSPTAPLAAGGALLVWEHNPSRTAQEVSAALLNTATPLGDPNKTGRGLFNLDAARKYLKGLP